MNTRNILVLLLALALGGCTSPDLHETAGQFIAAHARRIEAQEYAAARMVAVGDIDGDAIEDVAIIYTLEGAHHSNVYQQYLAVRRSSRNGGFLNVLAGGKEIREVDGIHIAAGRVELVLREYAPSDAACCPSRPARTAYIIKDGKLVEVRSIVLETCWKQFWEGGLKITGLKPLSLPTSFLPLF